MTNDAFLWAVVLLMGVSNLVFRLVPVAVVSRLRLPRTIERWLSYVPVAVLATIVTSEVLLPGGESLPLAENPYLMAAIPTAFVYHRTRNYVWATLVGVVAFLVFRSWVG